MNRLADKEPASTALSVHAGGHAVGGLNERTDTELRLGERGHAGELATARWVVRAEERQCAQMNAHVAIRSRRSGVWLHAALSGTGAVASVSVLTGCDVRGRGLGASLPECYLKHILHSAAVFCGPGAAVTYIVRCDGQRKVAAYFDPRAS